VRMGWIEREDCLAKNIEFRSNVFSGLDFSIDATDQHHSYAVFWKLGVKIFDKAGKKIPGTEIKILDKNKEEVFTKSGDENGSVEVELAEYTVDGEVVSYQSPYTVIVNNKKQEVTLNANKEISITTR